MVTLIAKRALSYGGRAYQAGETFDASYAHSKVLKLTKRAEDAPPPEPPAPQPERPAVARTRTRAIEAETAPAPAPMDTENSAPIAPPARRYTRRDMRAEGE
jgi:hypothetical protein